MSLTSVIITTHNRPKLLRRAVGSAFAAGTNLEVIVVDDASTDETATVCRDLTGIKCVRAERNQRVAGARNSACLPAVDSTLRFLTTMMCVCLARSIDRSNYLKQTRRNSVLFGLALSWLGPAAADVHDIAGPHLRGLGIGIYFSTVNIVAYGIGSPVIRKISDLLGASGNPGVMRYSLLLCPIACAISAWLLWKGNRALQATDGHAQ